MLRTPPADGFHEPAGYEKTLGVSTKKSGNLADHCRQSHLELIARFSLSIAAGETLLLEGKWNVTHTGVLQIARRHQCS
jgi:hypothetical protein